jgi:hypothetical protein
MKLLWYRASSNNVRVGLAWFGSVGMSWDFSKGASLRFTLRYQGDGKHDTTSR